MTYSKSELIDLVRLGSTKAIAGIRAQTNGDPLVAFALCTDDDLCSVTHVGCTLSYEDNSDVPGVRFLPGDWQQLSDPEPPELLEVSAHFQKTLRELAAPNWSARAPVLFDALVEGLYFAKLDAGALDASFLTVASMDPCDHTAQLEEQAISRLNEPAVVRAWRRWQLDGATAWLAQVSQKTPPLSWADEDHILRLRAEIERLGSLLDQSYDAG